MDMNILETVTEIGAKQDLNNLSYVGYEIFFKS
jgi:hypothetical protein